MKLSVYHIAVLGLSLFSCSKVTEQTSSQPNILLILADDLGYSDIGCYGGDIETPNLDRLAENGLKFTRFYNTARCCPSRASLMTGLHPHQTGMGSTQGVQIGRPGYIGELNEQCVTIGEVLRPAGYASYVVGKWHLTHAQDGQNKSDWPLQRGFDRFFGTIYGAGSYFDPRMLYHGNKMTTSSPEGFYYTDAISDTASLYINKHFQNQKEQPFFMYLAYTAPHWPMHAKPKDIAKYKGRFDKGWDVLRKEKLERMKSLGLTDEEWDIVSDKSNSPKWEDSPQKDWEINRMEVYAAMVDCMDQGIGRVLQQLEDENQLENTLIFFLSDNGGCAETWGGPNPWAARYGPKVTRTGKVIDYSNDGSRMAGPPDTYFSYGPNWARYSNTPFLGNKSGTYEGGISSPFIVHWPNGLTAKAQLRHQVSGIIDILPTIMAASGAGYPKTYKGNKIYPLAGLNLLPTIQEDAELVRPYYYVEHIGNKAIISDNHWKLVQQGEKDWELYDHQKDRTETLNFATQKPLLKDSLARVWENWAQRNNVLPIDTVNALRRKK